MSEHKTTTFVEFGPGKVLTGLIKRTAPDAILFNVATADQAQSVAQSI